MKKTRFFRTKFFKDEFLGKEWWIFLVSKNFFAIVAIFFAILFSVPVNASNSCTTNSSNNTWYEKAFYFTSNQTNSSLQLLSATRNVIEGNVAEYTFIIRTGTGEFDKIAIHRVTKENSAWHPEHSDDGVLMLHGDVGNFDTAFMLSTLSTNFTTNVSTNHSVAMYLAENGMDVWGLSLPWTFVPDNQTSFTFMQNWNTAKYIQDINKALKFAKSGRFYSGSGCDDMFFLGWSRGAFEVWAYANYETRLSPSQRDVKAIIPVDDTFKYDPVAHAAFITSACTRFANVNATRASGTYHSTTGQGVKGLPDAGLLVAATQTWTLVSPPPNTFYHFTAGQFLSNGTPYDTKYSNFNMAKVFVQYMPSFQSNGEILDNEAVLCGLPNSYDDNLTGITVPILNIAAAGGFGRTTLYTTSLTGSNDTNNTLIAFESILAEDLDYGHADLFWANNAPTTWWNTLNHWITTH